MASEKIKRAWGKRSAFGSNAPGEAGEKKKRKPNRSKEEIEAEKAAKEERKAQRAEEKAKRDERNGVLETMEGHLSQLEALDPLRDSRDEAVELLDKTIRLQDRFISLGGELEEDADFRTVKPEFLEAWDERVKIGNWDDQAKKGKKSPKETSDSGSGNRPKRRLSFKSFGKSK